MLELILFFLGASIVLYAILGGADFGAGIIEIFSPKEKVIQIEHAVYKALGPVWEANHMWAILAVVILFNGFPAYYAEISILLHFPLTFMLIGMILRGCAFTFRHYDAKQDNSALVYSWIFKVSSVITTFFIGVIVGALILGQFQIVNEPGLSYFETYWLPWFNPFCFAVGIFFVFLFAYQASVFFVGENIDDELKHYFIKTAKRFNVASMFAGIIVFLVSYFSGIDLFSQFVAAPISIVSVIVATALVFPIWKGLSNGGKWRERILSGCQMIVIIVGWANLEFPNFIRYSDGSKMSIVDAAAPETTLYYLSLALVFGVLIILPALVYLLAIMKSDKV